MIATKLMAINMIFIRYLVVKYKFFIDLLQAVTGIYHCRNCEYLVRFSSGLMHV